MRSKISLLPCTQVMNWPKSINDAVTGDRVPGRLLGVQLVGGKRWPI